MVWPFLRSTNTANVFMHIHPHGCRVRRKAKEGTRLGQICRAAKSGPAPEARTCDSGFSTAPPLRWGEAGERGRETLLALQPFIRESQHICHVSSTASSGRPEGETGGRVPDPVGRSRAGVFKGPCIPGGARGARKAKSQLLREAGRRVGRQNQSPFL